LFSAHTTPAVRLFSVAVATREVAPGEPGPELLCAVHIFEPIYLNGQPFLARAMQVYLVGVHSWLERLVAAGFLRQSDRNPAA
jgi:hypothetical protein